MQFASAHSRSVTGSMNELIADAKVLLADAETSPFDLGFRLNELLLSALASDRPRGPPSRGIPFGPSSQSRSPHETAPVPGPSSVPQPEKSKWGLETTGRSPTSSAKSSSTFLSAAETDEAFREEIPAFVAEIRDIFERWQLAAYLDIARQTERFDDADYDDPKEAEAERRLELRASAHDLLFVERAREWLLEE
jgi:hypothetical protein